MNDDDDPIVAEVRRIRRELSERHGGSLRAIVRAMSRELQRPTMTAGQLAELLSRYPAETPVRVVWEGVVWPVVAVVKPGDRDGLELWGDPRVPLRDLGPRDLLLLRTDPPLPAGHPKARRRE